MQRVLMVLLIACLALTPLMGATIPREAPDLAFFLPSGKQVQLDTYKGKVVALEFLLTTCSHCKRTSQTMQKLYQEYADKGFQPLGVAINPMPEIPKYVDELRITYPVGTGDRDVAVKFLQHPVMMTLMMPQLVVIDKTGTIRAQYPGTDSFFQKEEDNMRKLLGRLLAE